MIYQFMEGKYQAQTWVEHAIFALRERRLTTWPLRLNVQVQFIFVNITIIEIELYLKSAFDSIAWAIRHHLFTSAIPLLLSAGTFACCVSALGLYIPHYRTRYIAHSYTTTMLTLSLAWTPDRHRHLPNSGPELKPFASLACK